MLSLPKTFGLLLCLFQVNVPLNASEIINISIPDEVGSRDIFNELFLSFEAKTNTRVNLIPIKSMALLNDDALWFTDKGEPIDIFSGVASQYFLNFHNQGKVLPISHLWKKNQWEQPFSHYTDVISYGGEQLAIPYKVSSSQIFYRQGVLSQFSRPPTTLIELINTCKTFDKNGIIPFYISDSMPWLYNYFFEMIILRLHGVEFLKSVSAGEVSFLGSEIEQVFTIWKSLVDANCFSNKYGPLEQKDVLAYFYRNKIAMVFGRYHDIANISNTKVKEDLSFIPFPSLGLSTRFEKSAVDIFFANKKSNKKKLINMYLTFLASKEAQRFLAEKHIAIAANSNVNTAKNKTIQTLQQHMDSADGLSLYYHSTTPAKFYFGSHEPLKNFIANGNVKRVMAALEQLRIEYYQKKVENIHKPYRLEP